MVKAANGITHDVHSAYPDGSPYQLIWVSGSLLYCNRNHIRLFTSKVGIFSVFPCARHVGIWGDFKYIATHS